jgi:hypothetical protein
LIYEVTAVVHQQALHQTRRASLSPDEASLLLLLRPATRIIPSAMSSPVCATESPSHKFHGFKYRGASEFHDPIGGIFLPGK